MDAALPRRMTGFAALGLVACAAVGLVLGATKAAPAGADYRGGVVDSDGVPAAKALAAGNVGGLDEAAVRKIAREEAQAALGKPAKTADAASAPSPAKHVDQPAPSKLAKADQADSAPGDTPPTTVHHRKLKPVEPTVAPSAEGAGATVTLTVPPPPQQPAQVPDQY